MHKCWKIICIIIQNINIPEEVIGAFTSKPTKQK